MNNTKSVGRLQSCLEEIKKSNHHTDIETLNQKLKTLKESHVDKLITLTQETDMIAHKMSHSLRLRDTEQSRIDDLLVIVGNVIRVEEDTKRLESVLRSQTELDNHALSRLCLLYSQCQEHFNSHLCIKGVYDQRYHFKDRLSECQSKLLSILDRQLPSDLFISQKVKMNHEPSTLDTLASHAFSLPPLYALVGGEERGNRLLSDIMRAFTLDRLSEICSLANEPNNDIDFGEFEWSQKSEQFGDFILKINGWVWMQCKYIEYNHQEHQLDKEEHDQSESEKDANVQQGNVFKPANQILFATIRNALLQTTNTQTLLILENIPLKWIENDLRAVDLMLTDVVYTIGLLVGRLYANFDAAYSEDFYKDGSQDVDHGQMLFSLVPAEVVNKMGQCGAQYSELELRYLKTAISKAIDMNEIVMDPSKHSSCIDDCFFLAQKCANRAIVACDCECLLGVLSGILGELEAMLDSHLSIPKTFIFSTFQTLLNDVEDATQLMYNHCADWTNSLKNNTTTLLSLETIIYSSSAHCTQAHQHDMERIILQSERLLDWIRERRNSLEAIFYKQAFKQTILATNNLSLKNASVLIASSDTSISSLSQCSEAIRERLVQKSLESIQNALVKLLFSSVNEREHLKSLTGALENIKDSARRASIATQFTKIEAFIGFIYGDDVDEEDLMMGDCREEITKKQFAQLKTLRSKLNV